MLAGRDPGDKTGSTPLAALADPCAHRQGMSLSGVSHRHCSRSRHVGVGRGPGYSRKRLKMIPRVLNSLGPLRSSSKIMPTSWGNSLSCRLSNSRRADFVVQSALRQRRTSWSSASSCSSLEKSQHPPVLLTPRHSSPHLHSTAMIRRSSATTSVMPPMLRNSSTQATRSFRSTKRSLCNLPTSIRRGSCTCLM